jgi:hypothetical protein
MRCVDVLSNVPVIKEEMEEDDYEDLRHLQTALSFLSTSVGREALVTTLSKGKFIVPFLKCVKSEGGEMSALEKTARKGYAVEVLDFVVRASDSVDFIEKVIVNILNFFVIIIINFIFRDA